MNAIQEAALEDAFQESPILSDSRAEALAESLKCTFAQVKTYFHKRRGPSQRQLLAGAYYPKYDAKLATDTARRKERKRAAASSVMSDFLARGAAKKAAL